MEKSDLTWGSSLPESWAVGDVAWLPPQGAATCHGAWVVHILMGQGAQPHSTISLYLLLGPLGSTDPSPQKRAGANCKGF